MSLSDMLSPRLAEWLARAPEPQRYRTAIELDVLLDEWARAGVPLTHLGYSRAGHEIRAASLGHGPRSLLAWGYPHPDEPLGAEALAWLGSGMLDGALSDLADWTVHLILCADPDETARNQAFLHGARDVRSFVRGAWRPMQLPWEVDYGFELEWGPYTRTAGTDVFRCTDPDECLARCGGQGCQRRNRPWPPLPESAALAAAMDLFTPDLAVTMHGIAAGGDYTFVLEREPQHVFDALLSLPEACGSLRYLGERIDPGRRWRQQEPDLLHERGLDEQLRSLTRQPGYRPDRSYFTTTSAICYLQSQERGAQFATPEAAQFRHPDFADNRLSAMEELCQVAVEDRRHNRYELVRINVEGQWVVAHQDLAPDRQLQRPEEQLLPQTRGMLGVRALLARRRALAAADELWSRVERLEGLVDHPYRCERWLLEVPGAHVSDRSMLIFRTRADYRHLPTRAQRASFAWRWPLHTAALLANFQNFLAAQEQSQSEIHDIRQALDAIQDAQLEALPEEMLIEAPRAPALRSMLARVFALMTAKGH
jgi:hypothetical protein